MFRPDVSRATRPLRRARDWAVRRLRHGEDGFILLETIIAISLITVIMSALGAEYVNGLISTSHQRSTTTATQLADTAVEGLRALHASDLVTGRDNASTLSEYNTLSAIPAVQPWVDASVMTRAYDTAVATGGSTATVPTVAVTQKPGVTSFSVYKYLGWCWMAATGGSCTSTTAAVKYLRAVVAVVWTQRGCPNSTCSYVTSTLINADPDPTFDLNQTLPPAPTVTSPGNQTVAVNDTVNLQLLVDNNKGVAPFTWALTSGSLPTGLSINPAGLISGTVGGSAASASSVTITVTDAFLRNATVTFSWTVLPPLAITAAGPWANTTTDVVSQQLSATGGSGSGYVFTDPNSTLPPGLTMSSSGKITGTPTTTGVYTVAPTVTDSSGTRQATSSITWTITYPPLAVSNPGTQVTTINTSMPAVQLTASGGDGNYSWSSTGLPGGISVSSTGLLSGTPTALQSATTATITVSDVSAGVTAKSVTFTISVVSKPTVTAPSAQRSTKGATVSLQVPTTCPNTPCTYTMTGAPNNLAINSSGLITGTIASNATSSTSVKVTVTDGDGATATTGSFAWTVFAVPTITTPATQNTTIGRSASVQVSASCPNAPCTWSTNGNEPDGLSISSSGLISGTVATTATTSNSVKVVVTDASGVSATTSNFTWNVYAAPTVNIVDASVVTSEGSTPSEPVTYSCSYVPCTISLSTPVPGVGLSAAVDSNTNNTTTSLTVQTTSGTVYLTGKVQTTAVTGVQNTSTQAYTPSVTVTDSGSATASDSSAWTARTYPLIGWPGDVSVARSATVAQAFTVACVSTCTVSVTGAPSGVGLATSAQTTAQTTTSGTTSASSGKTLYLTGKVASGQAVGSSTVTLSVTDTISGASVKVSSVGVWTVS